MSFFLPSTRALQAFEAAARHLSYSRAAEELGLTHGAVSHHLARLEADLGSVRLLVRQGQGMRLTPAGQTFAIGARRILRSIGDLVSDVRAHPSGHGLPLRITLSVHPGFAARWLVSRLLRFEKLHPGIDVTVTTSAALAALNGRDGIDLAIRYGNGKWTGVQSERLMPSFLTPVCSPAFRELAKIEHDADIPRARLLRNPRQRWLPWFAAADVAGDEPKAGATYEDAGLLLDAAVYGQGIALARLALAADDLAAGRLVRLSPVQAEDDFAWFMAWREPQRCNLQAFEALRDWLHSEAAATG